MPLSTNLCSSFGFVFNAETDAIIDMNGTYSLGDLGPTFPAAFTAELNPSNPFAGLFARAPLLYYGVSAPQGGQALYCTESYTRLHYRALFTRAQDIGGGSAAWDVSAYPSTFTASVDIPNSNTTANSSNALLLSVPGFLALPRNVLITAFLSFSWSLSLPGFPGINSIEHIRVRWLYNGTPFSDDLFFPSGGVTSGRVVDQQAPGFAWSADVVRSGLLAAQVSFVLLERATPPFSSITVTNAFLDVVSREAMLAQADSSGLPWLDLIRGVSLASEIDYEGRRLRVSASGPAASSLAFFRRVYSDVRANITVLGISVRFRVINPGLVAFSGFSSADIWLRRPDGTLVGPKNATPDVNGDLTAGGPADLWGAGWTYADVDDEYFGCAVRLNFDGADTVDLRVVPTEFVPVRVYTNDPL